MSRILTNQRVPVASEPCIQSNRALSEAERTRTEGDSVGDVGNDGGDDGGMVRVFRRAGQGSARGFGGIGSLAVPRPRQLSGLGALGEAEKGPTTGYPVDVYSVQFRI